MRVYRHAEKKICKCVFIQHFSTPLQRNCLYFTVQISTVKYMHNLRKPLILVASTPINTFLTKLLFWTDSRFTNHPGLFLLLYIYTETITRTRLLSVQHYYSAVLPALPCITPILKKKKDTVWNVNKNTTICKSKFHVWLTIEYVEQGKCLIPDILWFSLSILNLISNTYQKSWKKK